MWPCRISKGEMKRSPAIYTEGQNTEMLDDRHLYQLNKLRQFSHEQAIKMCHKPQITIKPILGTWHIK